MYLGPDTITIRFPTPHEHQQVFLNWDSEKPGAQALIAPCGTKLGKSFGCAMWLLKEALINPNIFGIWIGPTYRKAKIGFRYMKAMLPDVPEIQCVDGKLEIRLANGSYICFLHGKDAEATVEGEATNAFVIDEAGKQTKQLWFSLFTTITQTRGKGIVTGTPRGFTWYYDEFRKAKLGDPFYHWAHLPTALSPYVHSEAIENARRLLPLPLFQQYYEAKFVSASTVFGDLSGVWDEQVRPKNPLCKFWIHPDEEARKADTVTGYDVAKHRDYAVFMTFNLYGKMVGYARMRKVPYEVQVSRLKHYMHTYFGGDRMLRYDKTGVGDAVGEMIADQDIDASITGVTFTNQSKREMVARTTIAIETGWARMPRIEQIEHEFGSFEVNVTKSGLFSYSAPEGEHDDCVTAGMLSISGAYQTALADEAEKMVEQVITDSKSDADDEITAYAKAVTEEDDFFDDDQYDSNDDDFEFNFDDM